MKSTALFFAPVDRGNAKPSTGRVSGVSSVETPGGAVARMLAFVRNWVSELRDRREFVALLDAECVQDLAGEISAECQRIRALAHNAQVHDLEAASLLERALTDGLGPDDLPAVLKVLRLIRRSAESDRQIGEVARV
jgi:hypothetical protein